MDLTTLTDFTNSAYSTWLHDMGDLGGILHDLDELIGILRLTCMVHIDRIGICFVVIWFSANLKGGNKSGRIVSISISETKLCLNYYLFYFGWSKLFWGYFQTLWVFYHSDTHKQSNLCQTPWMCIYSYSLQKISVQRWRFMFTYQWKEICPY